MVCGDIRHFSLETSALSGLIVGGVDEEPVHRGSIRWDLSAIEVSRQPRIKVLPDLWFPFSRVAVAEVLRRPIA